MTRAWKELPSQEQAFLSLSKIIKSLISIKISHIWPWLSICRYLNCHIDTTIIIIIVIILQSHPLPISNLKKRALFYMSLFSVCRLVFHFVVVVYLLTFIVSLSTLECFYATCLFIYMLSKWPAYPPIIYINNIIIIILYIIIYF